MDENEPDIHSKLHRKSGIFFISMLKFTKLRRDASRVDLKLEKDKNKQTIADDL